MKLIGLTGGIASGKSTIARRLSEHGAQHIDADQLAREAVEPGSPGLARVRERFGEAVIRADGSLDRARLGELVFSDAGARADLNAVVHPEVRRLAEAHISAAAQRDPAAIVVYDVPLLVESGLQMPWDLVVVAEAPAAMRVERLRQPRGRGGGEAAGSISGILNTIMIAPSLTAAFASTHSRVLGRHSMMLAASISSCG